MRAIRAATVPTTDPDIGQIAAARRWFRAVGQGAVRDGAVTLVASPAHPDTWELNAAMFDPGCDPVAAIATLDRHFAHTAWRVVHGDALDDPAVEASLALAGFEAKVTTIELLARGPVGGGRTRPEIATVAVDERNWADFAALVEIDHREGLRTGDTSAEVGAGLLAAMRARLSTCDYKIIVANGAAAGYGMSVAAPGGLGIIEHLFTLPDRRGRGIMSAFIVDTTARLHAQGCTGVFLDAHASDSPARLYAGLGFAPVALARTWCRRLS